MTLADIDKALAQWESRLSSAAHNLFDLQADPTYQCLSGTGGAPQTPIAGVLRRSTSSRQTLVGGIGLQVEKVMCRGAQTAFPLRQRFVDIRQCHKP